MQRKLIRGRQCLNIKILIRCVLFIEILASRVALDNADRYGTSDCSTGHIETAFLAVTSGLRKSQNAGRYGFDDMTQSRVQMVVR